MVCGYCKGDKVFLKEQEDKTGVYCQSCGRWLKWVDGEEKIKISEEIAKQKREIRIDGLDLETVREKYKAYKKKHDGIAEDIKYYKQRTSNKKNTNELEAAAMYDKALKLKELSAKLAAFDEVLITLRLK